MTLNLGPAIALIKRFEGLGGSDPATSNYYPYLCPAGVWTIGYGHALRDSDGRLLRGQADEHFAKAMYPRGISLEHAEAILIRDVRKVWRQLEQVLPPGLKLNPNQLCALVSFVYNIGIGAFKNSTLLKELTNNNLDAAPTQMRRWTKSGGRVLRGLIRRREAEIELWNTPPAEPRTSTTSKGLT